MVFLVLYILSLVAVLCLGFLAGWSDYKGMVIPNYIVGLVLCLFFVSYAVLYFAGVEIFSDIRSHLVAGFLVFFITFLMFIAKAIGGGDSKLAAAFAFWVGLEGVQVYLFVMVLVGGFFSLISIILKIKKPFRAPLKGSWVARVQSGESVVPYGIAIVAGAFAAFVSLGFLSLENLSLFLMPN